MPRRHGSRRRTTPEQRQAQAYEDWLKAEDKEEKAQEAYDDAKKEEEYATANVSDWYGENDPETCDAETAQEGVDLLLIQDADRAVVDKTEKELWDAKREEKDALGRFMHALHCD